MNSKLPVSTLVLALLLMLGFVFAGCSSSKPKVDWNSRVGNYTYDQAVQELGPPDKTAKLTDGTTVAEWVTGHHSSGTGLSIGTGVFGGGGGVGVSQGISSGNSYDSVLKLTFTVDGKLASWAKK